jgi:hypothetical protein
VLSSNSQFKKGFFNEKPRSKLRGMTIAFQSQKSGKLSLICRIFSFLSLGKPAIPSVTDQRRDTKKGFGGRHRHKCLDTVGIPSVFAG